MWLAGLAMLLLAATAAAEPAWVRGGIRLNVRTEPGTQYRILGVITTGDEITILDRSEEWTKIRAADGMEGWIPRGYLQPDPPANLTLDRMKQENEELKIRVELLTTEMQQLRDLRKQLGDDSATQQAEIERLTIAHQRARSGVRHREWLTGGALLGGGMIAGALLRRGSGRRPSPRIRL